MVKRYNRLSKDVHWPVTKRAEQTLVSPEVLWTHRIYVFLLICILLSAYMKPLSSTYVCTHSWRMIMLTVNPFNPRKLQERNKLLVIAQSCRTDMSRITVLQMTYRYCTILFSSNLSWAKVQVFPARFGIHHLTFSHTELCDELKPQAPDRVRIKHHSPFQHLTSETQMKCVCVGQTLAYHWWIRPYNCVTTKKETLIPINNQQAVPTEREPLHLT